MNGLLKFICFPLLIICVPFFIVAQGKQLIISYPVSSGDGKARDLVNAQMGTHLSAVGSDKVHLFLDKTIQVPEDYQPGGVNNSDNAINTPIDFTLPVGSVNGYSSVNAVGQASYTIPIYTPPGTKGIQPALGIHYNSALADGIMGRGWSLSGISVITRVGEELYYDGLKQQIVFGSPDGFSLDGQRMIPTGTPGEYRMENENFSIINAVAGAFVLKTKEGVTYEYGNTNDSKLKVTTPSNQLAWYLDKVYDNYGNYMVYTYNNSNGEVTVKEIKYTGNVAANIPLYNTIKFYYDKRNDASVRYLQDNSFSSTLILREIEIFCEDISTKRYQFKYGFSSQTFLNEITEAGSDFVNLNSTFIKYGDNANTGSAVSVTLPSLTTSGTSLIPNADYRTGDFNGDGKTDLLAFVYSSIGTGQFDNGIRYYTGEWKLYINQDDGTTFSNVANGNIPHIFPYGFNDFINNLSPQPLGLESADFDGDGMDDLLVGTLFSGTITYSVYRSTGNGFGSTALTTYSTGNNYNFVIADINGDAKPELIVYHNPASTNDYNFELYSFDGTMLGSLTSTFFDKNGASLVTPVYSGFTAIDFDGDGTQELLGIRGGAQVVLKLNVSHTDIFGAKQRLLTVKEVYNSTLPSVFYQTFLGDFNGDRIIDNLSIDPYTTSGSTGSAFVNYGTGKAYSSSSVLTGTVGAYVNGAIGSSALAKSKYNLLDINNDGKTDVLYMANSTTTSITFDVVYGGQSNSKTNLGSWSGGSLAPFLFFPDHTVQIGLPCTPLTNSTCLAFIPNTYPSNYNEVAEYLIGDFDGDGRQDIFFKTANNGQRAIAYFNKGSTSHLATAVTDGFRRKSSFQYTTLANGSGVYTKGTGNTYPVVDWQAPFYVVTHASVPDGIGGVNTTDYTYEGATVHLQGKGFLGFKKTTSVNSTFLRKTVNENILNLTYFENIPLKSQTYLLSGALISQQDFVMQFVDLGNLGSRRHFTKPDHTISTDFVTGKSVTVTYSFDTNGNLVSKNTNTLNGTEIVQETYTISPTIFGNSSLPSKISNSQITITRQGQDPYTRATQYDAYNIQGDVTHIVNDPNTPKLVQTSNVYDDAAGGTGVLKRQTASCSDPVADFIPPSKTSHYDYDTYKRFVTTFTNPLNQISTTAYDARWGKPLVQTTADNLTTTYTYDSYGRTTSVVTPDNLALITTYAWVQPGDLQPDPDADLDVTNSVYSVTGQKSGAPKTIVFYDVLNRERKTETDGFNNKVFAVKGYDARGNVARETGSYETVSGTDYTRLLTKYTYNELNRMTSAVTDDKNLTNNTEYSYFDFAGFTDVSITTPDHKVYHKITDPTGLLVGASDPAAGITYDYYSNRQLKSTTVAGTQTNYIEYDIYGRQTKLTEKNSGTTTYNYNGYGLLSSQTDANNQTYTFKYDELDRVMTKTGPEGVYTNTYVNNGNGLNLLKTETTPDNISCTYTYDKLRRITQKEEHVAGQVFNTAYQYDDFSNLIRQIYPGGFATQNMFNDHGYHTKTVRADNGNLVWQADAMNPMGRYIKYTLGNGIQTQKTYTNFNLPVRYVAHNLQHLNFVFDVQNGNLTSRMDALKNTTETFTYDATLNNRLAAAQIGSATVSVNYLPNGNINSKSDIGTYEYDGTKNNALVSVSNSNGLISSGTQNIAYTPFNKANTITEADRQLKFSYGPQNERSLSELYRVSTNTKLSTRYFIGDYEKTIDQTSGAVTEVNYINCGDNLVGMYVTQSGSPANLYFVYTDHLGSILTVTNTLGTVVAEQSFDAWGNYRNPNTWHNTNIPAQPTWLYRGYTGHEHLNVFGLVNMNGRMYDPLLGRMLSPDNFVQDNTSTQGYNRYSYCLNNPLKYTDPDGNVIVLAPILIGMAYGALIGAGTSAAIYATSTAITGQQWDWGAFGRATAFGAVGGALGGGLGGLGAQLGTFGQSLGYNVLSNVASNSATTLAFGGDITAGGFVGMVAGGFIGASIGNFSGVSGGALKNIGAELAFGVGKGAVTGGFGGAIGAAIDGKDIGQGFVQAAKYGAIAGGTLAGLNIATMGVAYKPSRSYGNFGRNGPVYRRGTFLTRALAGEGSGIAIGRNLVTHQMNENVSYGGEFDPVRFNHFLRAHETGHFQQQAQMGFGYFYAKTAYQYLINPGFSNVYYTPGTLEYGADQYAKYLLGYGY